MVYFEAVCRNGSLTKAAEELYVSQPAMSNMIRKLENECGVALFKRVRNRLEMTQEGKLLLSEVLPVLRQVKQLDRFAAQLPTMRMHLKIGFTTICGNMVYPQLWRRFTAVCPEVQVLSFEDSPIQLFKELDKGNLNLVISSDPETPIPYDFRKRLLFNTERLFYVSRDDPLARLDRPITLEEIAERPLILQDVNRPFTRWLEERFGELGLTMNVVHRTDQLYTMENFIENGVACGFLLKYSLERNPAIIGLPYEGAITVPTVVFTRAEETLSETARIFLRTAQELCSDLI